MNINFMVKSLLLLLLIPVNYNLVYSMEESVEELSDTNSCDMESFIKTPESLEEMVGLEVAKQAAEKYNKSGFAGFENYLNSVINDKMLNDEVKIQTVYCKLINQLNRADIFVKKLKEICKVSKVNAFKYFSSFCHEAQEALFVALLNEGVNAKELLEYIVDQLEDLHQIIQYYDELHHNKTICMEKSSEKMGKNAKKKLDFKLALFEKLMSRLQTKIASIVSKIDATKKSVEVSITSENLKFAKVLIDILDKRWTDGAFEETFINVISRFKKLDKKDQIEILQYIFIENAPLSSANSDQAFFLLGQSLEWFYSFDRSTNEELKNVLDFYFEILNKFDQVYPELKKITFLERFQDVKLLHATIFNQFIEHVNNLVKRLTGQLIMDEKFQEALNFLIDLNKKTRKLNINRGENGPRDSILQNFYELLDSLTVIGLQSADYYKKLYSLLKTSIITIKLQFQELSHNTTGQEEGAKEFWSEELIRWLSFYIDELKIGHLATEEEINKLIEDFKKEILEKFES